MSPAAAQAFRRLGLVVEVLAMAGFVWRARGSAPFLERLPFDPTTALAGLFALGFGLWLVGTLNLLAARRGGTRGRRPPSDAGGPGRPNGRPERGA